MSRYIKIRVNDDRYEEPVLLHLSRAQTCCVRDLKQYLQETQWFCDKIEKIQFRKISSGDIFLLSDNVDVSDNLQNIVLEIIAKTDTEIKYSSKLRCDEELSQKWTQMSTENNGLREELMALKASKGMIETKVKALRDAMKDMKEMADKGLNQELMSLYAINKELLSLKEMNERNQMELKELFKTLKTSDSKTDCTSGGKGSQNPLNTTSGDKNAIEMFNEISKHMEMTNSLLNAMNGQKNKALTALEGIRHVMDNTDTESTVSVQTLSETMDQLNIKFKSCGQMSGNCVDSESVANTSTSQSTEDLSPEPMADNFSSFLRKCYQKLSQMNEIWKSLSGLSSSVRTQVMKEMWTQFTDQLTHDKNKLFS